MNERANLGRLWRADRACDDHNPALSARPDRAGLGVSDRERPAPPVARGGADGDEGRRAVRTRLAQQRADQPARANGRKATATSTGWRAGSPSSTRPARSFSPGERAAATFRSSSSREARGCCLTVIHRRLPDRGMLLGVSSGWHAHLDILAARLAGSEPQPFWDGVARLRRRIRTPYPDLTAPSRPELIVLKIDKQETDMQMKSFRAMSGSWPGSDCSRRRKS